MKKRIPIGVVNQRRGIVRIGSILALYAKKSTANPPIELCDIPIPESLAGCPDETIVYVTPAGLLAWEYDGKLVTRFDHVNK